MAYQEDYYYYYTQTPPCLDWDLQGSFGAETGVGVGVEVGFLSEHMSLVMESPSCQSTGYLEDAVADWSDRSKRRRVLPAANAAANVEDILQEFWYWNFHQNPLADLDFTSRSCKTIQGCDELLDHSSTISCKDSITTQGGSTLIEAEPISSSSSSDKHIETPRLPPTAATMTEQDVTKQLSGDDCSALRTSEKKRRRKKKKVVMGVIYPFSVVKPGGIDGRMTLDDINERLLRRPTRPVRHPVGEFACLPCVTAADGPGLSGKAVIGLTRIHTRGRGTITIIRTRG